MLDLRKAPPRFGRFREGWDEVDAFNRCLFLLDLVPPLLPLIAREDFTMLFDSCYVK
jgi:hypothetical protein